MAAARRPVLAVQDRQRLFREAFCESLRHYLPDVEVADGGPDALALLELAGRKPLAYVVLEVGPVPWDVSELLSRLRSVRPGMEVVGLAGTGAGQISGAGMTVVPRTASPARVADLLQPGSERPLPFMLTATARAGGQVLTERQLKVLSLLSLGLTGAQVAARLGLSERGVAKSKHAIFTKLGVQSQAEALSAALSAGLLGPPRREEAS